MLGQCLWYDQAIPGATSSDHCPDELWNASKRKGHKHTVRIWHQHSRGLAQHSALTLVYDITNGWIFSICCTSEILQNAMWEALDRLPASWMLVTTFSSTDATEPNTPNIYMQCCNNWMRKEECWTNRSAFLDSQHSNIWDTSFPIVEYHPIQAK